MKALGVTTPGEALQEVDLGDPQPGPGEVVLDVSHCGVCHSDVHLWEGGFDFGGQKMSLEAMGIPLPLVLGHEILGTVSAVGEGVSDIRIGERRIVYPWIGCGDCPRCAEGRDDLCQGQVALGIRESGGFGDKVKVRDTKYLVDPGDIDPAWAATLACSGLTAYGAVDKLMPLDQEAGVVVIGAGGVGLSAVGVLKARGHENITVVDIEDGRLQTAREAGARQVVNSATADDPVGTVMAAAGGDVMGVIDFVNGAQTAPLAFALPAKGGAIVQVGLFGGSFPLPLAAMAVRAIRMEGAYVGSLAQLKALVELAKSGKLKPPPIRKAPRGEAGETLAGLRDGKIVGRVVLES